MGRTSPRAVIASLCRAKAGSSGVSPHQSGFTMVEIAISLAVIGIALVAIIGVLPMGMNVQKDNREETIINQDATVFMAAIRNYNAGATNEVDLTNYVYAITNFQTTYKNGVAGTTNTYGYTLNTSFALANNARIIGLLSTPEYTVPNVSGNPAYGNPVYGIDFADGNYNSNHIVAYVRSISGSAVEKPPQDNPILQQNSFSYKILFDNMPVAVDTNVFNLSPDQTNYIYAQQLTANLHELRLTFLWPLLPNGDTGAGRQSFRTMVSGQIMQTNDPSVTPSQPLYYFQSQSFTNAP
ncbi:MAG: type II secretion system protein [Limisphaerales bacterium]